MQIAKKIILSMLMVILVLNIIYIPKIFAISDIISDANDFLSEAEGEKLPIDQENLKATSSKIYNILLACGIAVAVAVGAVLGITFILSSVEGKAKIQEALLPYVVGCVVVFGAFTIWKIAIETGNSIDGINFDKEMQEVRMENSELVAGIENGTIIAENLDDQTLKKAYTANSIDLDLQTATKGDPRGGGKGTIKTLEEAIKGLSPVKQKIYNACKKKNLLDDSGIYIKN